MSITPLWEATRDIHHACEAHPVGHAMAQGNPPKKWYAAWLTALHQIHSAIDDSMAYLLQREYLLANDITDSGFSLEDSKAANLYIQTLKTENDIAGACYVLTGAHLMGGEIMRRKLIGYPTSHLTWQDRQAALQELHKLRSRTDIVDSSRACFAALLSVMDEIMAKYPEEVADEVAV